MNFLLLLISYFLTHAGEVKCEEISEVIEVYESCNENGTLCYGDTEKCIEEKTCMYLTNLIEMEDDFQIQFWDRCDHNGTHDFLFALGAATYDPAGEFDCSQTLEMKHFKLFTFWDRIKCPIEIEKQFGNMSKISEFKINKESWKSMCEIRQNQTVSFKKEPLTFFLRSYLQRHIYYSVAYGRWKYSKPSYKFAENHQYFTKDGIFYLTNLTDVANLLKNSSPSPKKYFLHGCFGWIALTIICLKFVCENNVAR